ncbi:MAG: trigger factor [Armatimonadetes bacterium]|nr:trigger factor [Armatimonadota bacterium]
MKVEWRREPQSRAVLEVELPAEEVSRAVETAGRRLAQRMAIPGFRRGKAPRAILERYVGRDRLMDETVGLLVSDGYARAVKEAGLAPIGRPEIDVRTEQVDEGAPLRFVATVDVAPEVDPGAYRTVRVARAEPVVTDADVEKTIDDLRLRHATLASAGEEAAARGDFVLIEVLEGAPGLSRLPSGKEVLVEIGAGVHPAALEEGLIGLRREEQRTIDLGNETGRITVAAGDVKRRDLPALDETFARQTGAGSVEDLRGALRGRMAGEAAARATEAYEAAVVSGVTDQATVELPRTLVAHEAEHLYADLVDSLGRRGLTLESYLRAAERTEEQVRDDLAATATQRLRTQLVLDEIARRESIAPTEEEIAAEVENLAQSLQQDVARVREWLDDERRRDALVRSLRRRQTIRFLVALASGQETPKEDA